MTKTRSRMLGLLAALAFVAAAAVLALGAAGGDGGTSATAARSGLPQANAGIAAGAIRRTHPEPKPKRPAVLPLPGNSYGVVFVKDGKRIAVRTAPGAGRLVKRAGPRTSFGSRTVFSVVHSRGRWAAVVTPFLPNGQLGWIRLDPNRLGSYGSDWSVEIDLSSRRGALIRDGRTARSFAVTVGAPGTETPVGRFAITDTFRGGLNPAYGCCAAALSAHQPKIPSGWLGGSRIAIHGTVEPLGQALSHGCVRASNADVSAIVSKVPIGSPIVIHE